MIANASGHGLARCREAGAVTVVDHTASGATEQIRSAVGRASRFSCCMPFNTPSACFDVVHAHNMFSHSPAGVVEECLAHVGRILKPEGFFDFTFKGTEPAEQQVLHEDFYYRTETVVGFGGGTAWLPALAGSDRS